jgi:hypothetical protein
MATAERERRAAQNQMLFRSVNGRIKELGEKVLHAVSQVDFACECNDAECHDAIAMTIEEFAAIDAKTNRFIVRPGHEDLDVEDVVDTRDSYLIVAKRGAGREFVKQNS